MYHSIPDFIGFLLSVCLSVAKSANRAFCLLIVKSKDNGGFQYSTFTKPFDALVWPVIN